MSTSSWKTQSKVIDETNSPDIIQKFHNVQLQAAKKTKFYSLNTWTRSTKTEFRNDLRFTAYDVENNAIAYGLILIDGKEADYYEAASTPPKSQIAWRLCFAMTSHAAISKNLASKRYNLWGIAPEGQTNHRYSGVTTFTKLVSSERFTYVSAQDIPIRKFRYKINRIVRTYVKTPTFKLEKYQ